MSVGWIVCLFIRWCVCFISVFSSAVSNKIKNTSLPVESNFYLLFNGNRVQNNIIISLSVYHVLLLVME